MNKGKQARSLVPKGVQVTPQQLDALKRYAGYASRTPKDYPDGAAAIPTTKRAFSQLPEERKSYWLKVASIWKS